MTEPFIEGWDRIAGVLGRCVRTCRTMSARPHDPLPVFKVGGVVRILRTDLEAWLERQRLGAVRPALATLEELRGEITMLRAEVRQLISILTAPAVAAPERSEASHVD